LHYITILSSVIDLIRQQCNTDWIGCGDYCTKYLFAKAKQRKIETYVYEIKDDNGQSHQGFEAVATLL